MSKYDINNLTIKEKIGQLAMFGIESTEITEDTINLIKEYKVGNIILFARNVASPKQLFLLNQNLQKLALKELGIPLFISIDQEGGMVTRIFNGSTFFPGAMTISATNNPENAYQIGQIMGKELSALGINMNLAPIYDVNNNPHNPVIGVRSFSDDPKVVSKYAWEFSKGLQENNVFATAKHFPGHGDTNVDSHLGLPRIDYDREYLDNFEFYPFKYAIDRGIKAIMSSHINFPKLTNDELPATLSKKIMTDLLRTEFKFEGLIVSDGMGMKGIVDNYSEAEGCLRGINAGLNLVCVCHPYSPRREALEYLYEAYEKGTLTDEVINERVLRVLKFKEELKVDLNIKYEDVKNDIENEEHQQIAYQIVEDGLTLVKGENVILQDNALFIAYKPIATSLADDTDGKAKIESVLNKNFPNLTTIVLPTKPSVEVINDLVLKAKDYKQIILTTYAGNSNKEQITLIDKISDIHNNVTVISMRDPYDLFYTKKIKNYVCLYEYTPNSLNVLVKYLKGEIIPNGVIPIKYE